MNEKTINYRTELSILHIYLKGPPKSDIEHTQNCKILRNTTLKNFNSIRFLGLYEKDYFSFYLYENNSYLYPYVSKSHLKTGGNIIDPNALPDIHSPLARPRYFTK